MGCVFPAETVTARTPAMPLIMFSVCLLAGAAGLVCAHPTVAVGAPHSAARSHAQREFDLDGLPLFIGIKFGNNHLTNIARLAAGSNPVGSSAKRNSI